MKHDTGAIGRRGEELAARDAEARGWRVVARNLRTPAGEADVVAERHGAEGRELIVIEVKTTTSQRALTFRVDQRKSARLWAIAEYLVDAAAVAHAADSAAEPPPVKARVALVEVRLDVARTEVGWRWLEAW